MKSLQSIVLVFMLAVIYTIAWAQPGAVKPAYKTKTKSNKTVTQKPLPKGQIYLMVESEYGECDAVASKKCLLVKPVNKKFFELQYEPIEGFAYEEGYLYNIVVKIDSVYDVPSAPTYKYTLVKVISKTPDNKPLAPDIKVLEVSEETTPCEDALGKRNCILVREPGKKFFEIQYEPIEGFQHVAGIAYKIQVRVTSIQGDAGKPMTYKYSLVKIISQTQVGGTGQVTTQPSVPAPNPQNTPIFSGKTDSTGLSGKLWKVQLFRIDTTAYDVRELEINMLIHPEQGRISGKSACNNYFANLTAAGKFSFKLGPLGSTKMYCSNVAKTEELFYQALQSVDNYEILNNVLYLKKGDKAVIELK